MFCLDERHSKTEEKSHLRLRELHKQPSGPPLPPLQSFLRWTPLPETRAGMNPPNSGSHQPPPSPLGEVGASVPELSTPLPFHHRRRGETLARPGPTRTAVAWRAMTKSSVKSSYWRGRTANRWCHWGLRRSTVEEGCPEWQKYHSQMLYSFIDLYKRCGMLCFYYIWNELQHHSRS